MTTKRLLRITCLAALAGLFLSPFAAWFLFLYGPRWESGFEKRAARIHDGMTVEEVEQVLGFAGMEHEQRYVPSHWSENGSVPFVHGERIMLWEVNGEQVWVGFDSGRVISKLSHDLNYL